MVRSPARDNAYAADYDDMTMLKRFADSRNVAVLLVHHTRKMGDNDVFNTVSGTTGVTGSGDSSMVLVKDARMGDGATLSVTGRDIEQQEFKIKLKDCHWHLVERMGMEEMVERQIPECVLRVVEFMDLRGVIWSGTASELVAITDAEINPSVLPKKLNQYRWFLEDKGIAYARERNREQRTIILTFILP